MFAFIQQTNRGVSWIHRPPSSRGVHVSVRIGVGFDTMSAGRYRRDTASEQQNPDKDYSPANFFSMEPQYPGTSPETAGM